MHKQLTHICRQLLASETDFNLRRIVRRWVRHAKTRDYEWLAKSMRRHGKNIRSHKLQKQVKVMADILEERFVSSEESEYSPDEEESDEDSYYKIDRIVGMRFVSDDEVLYQVRWVGFGSDEDTWEERDKLIEDGCKDRITRFHREIAALRG